MSNMTPAVEQWSLYSAAQNLPAVLNDPNRGKQSNFFVKTWGDTFVEKTEIGKSPFLPEISHSHFESYLRKIAKRYRRHRKISQSKIEANNIKTKSRNEPNNTETINLIPDIFLKNTLHLNNSVIFNAVFPNIGTSKDNKNTQSGRLLQEQLSHYLDIVEVQIAKQVSQKSGAFFHAMTSHDTIMEQMGVACKEVRTLRSKVQEIDKKLAKDSLKILGLARFRENYNNLLDKLKLMATVLQTQPTIQLLLSSSDYVAALELIAGTQEVLARELAGVTSLRHLPSQLKEMSRLIDNLLSTEFERYAAADLHRPFDNTNGVLEPERLVSLVAGLLRQSHLHFLEIYKQEAVTAAQTLLKQLLIEQLADVEDDIEHCFTGSGEAPPSLDASHWLNVLSLASGALGKLIHRVRAVHDVIKQTADISAGLSEKIDFTLGETEKFLSVEEHARVEAKLKDLLTSVCDYCHERLASIVSTQSDKQNITAGQVVDLSNIVESFNEECEAICGKQSPALKASFKILAGNYVHKFHIQRKTKLTLLLDAERWKVADVPPEFQILADKLASGAPLKSIPSSPVEERNGNAIPLSRPASFLKIGAQEYVTVGTVLMLIRLVSEYCVCAYDVPVLANVIGRNMAELLRTFNSRSCQLVLGAGALRTAGLKTITSTNLALTSRALQLVLWMIPHIRSHFSTLCTDTFTSLDSIEKDIGHHIQQLETKVLSIMNTLLGDQLNDWDAKPPVPSKAFRNVSRHLTKLHEAVSNVLPEEQVSDIYEIVHKNFKARLRDQLIKMNIQNNGGPQHGVVTSELTFYLETMKSLKVLSEKHITNTGMEDIWVSSSSRREQEEKDEIWKNRIAYSLPVKIGLWTNTIALKEMKQFITRYRREHCYLYLQRVKLMFKNVLTNVTLSSKTQFVYFNELYQIKASELPNKINQDLNKKTMLGLFLSALINERIVEFAQRFVHGCLLTASADRISCVRNSFMLVGADQNREGQLVYFGQDFYIQIAPEYTDTPLYVTSEEHTIDNIGGYPQLYMTNVPDMYSRFKCFHYNPELRDETTGSSFTPNTKIIIQQTATGRNLAAEYTNWIPTFFGAECVVTCHNYTDSHRMETAENIWMIVGNVPPNMNLYVRAAKGEDIPEEMLM